MKCLDLINCYFTVILDSNKKIPIDFNYNYFYTGVRCILESNHSILLQSVNINLFRCCQYFISTIIFSVRNLFSLWITILSIMSLINCLCIGINLSEICFIFCSPLEFLKCKVIILKLIPNWALACMRKGVIIAKPLTRISCTSDSSRIKIKKGRSQKRRSTISKWKIKFSRKEKSFYSKVDLPWNH